MKDKNDYSMEEVPFSELIKLIGDPKPFNFDVNCNPEKQKLKEAIEKMHVEGVVAQGLWPIVGLGTSDFSEVYECGIEYDFFEVSDDDFDKCYEKLFVGHSDAFRSFRHGIIHIVVSEKTEFSSKDLSDFVKRLAEVDDADKYYWGITKDPYDEINLKIQMLVYNTADDKR